MSSIGQKIKQVFPDIAILKDQDNYSVFNGRYYYRSGSVKQELTGAALNEFLLERIGKKWDSVPVPSIQVEDLKPETFTFFKERGIKSGRIEEVSRNDTPLQILENLKIVDKNFLNRAAVMLFHPDPEKFVSGACDFKL